MGHQPPNGEAPNSKSNVSFSLSHTVVDWLKVSERPIPIFLISADNDTLAHGIGRYRYYRYHKYRPIPILWYRYRSYSTKGYIVFCDYSEMFMDTNKFSTKTIPILPILWYRYRSYFTKVYIVFSDYSEMFMDTNKFSTKTLSAINNLEGAVIRKKKEYTWRQEMEQ